MKWVFALWVALFLFLFSEPLRADIPIDPNLRYFFHLFGTENAAHDFDETHTWGAVTAYDTSKPLKNARATGALKRISISWLPLNRIVETFKLGPQRGRNRDAVESFVHVRRNGTRLAMHEPREVTLRFAELFQQQHEKLRSGEVWYRVQDFNHRVLKHFLPTAFPWSLVCFHALSDVVLPDDPRGFLLTGRAAGFAATDMIAWHLAPWYARVAGNENVYKPIEPDLRKELDLSLEIPRYHFEVRQLVDTHNVYCKNSLKECQDAMGKLIVSQLQQI